MILHVKGKSRRMGKYFLLTQDGFHSLWNIFPNLYAYKENNHTYSHFQKFLVLLRLTFLVILTSYHCSTSCKIQFIFPLAIYYFRPHPHLSITPVTTNSPYLITPGIIPSFLGLVSIYCRVLSTGIQTQ